MPKVYRASTATLMQPKTKCLNWAGGPRPCLSDACSLAILFPTTYSNYTVINNPQQSAALQSRGIYGSTHLPKSHPVASGPVGSYALLSSTSSLKYKSCELMQWCACARFHSYWNRLRLQLLQGKLCRSVRPGRGADLCLWALGSGQHTVLQLTHSTLLQLIHHVRKSGSSWCSNRVAGDKTSVRPSLFIDDVHVCPEPVQIMYKWSRPDAT